MPKIVVAATNIFRVPRLENDVSNNEAGSRLEVAERRMEGMDKNITELLKRDTLTRTELEAKINAMDVGMKEMDKNMIDFISNMKNEHKCGRSAKPLGQSVIALPAHGSWCPSCFCQEHWVS